MSNKVNGLWAVNSSSVFMFFDSVNSPSVWRFEMKDGVESWRMIPGVKNAQAVRGVAAAYRADGGTWLDPNGPDYAQAVSEIGDVPLIVERGDCMVSPDCGDYTAHGVSLSDSDREHGWELSYEDGGLDYEDAEEYAKLAATVPWSMEEIDRVAEQSFRYVSDRTLQVAYALCVLTFDAMFPQKIEVVKPDVRETLLSVAFPHDWQRRMAESDHDRVSVYRMGLECVTKAYDKVFDRLGEAD